MCRYLCYINNYNFISYQKFIVVDRYEVKLNERR